MKPNHVAKQQVKKKNLRGIRFVKPFINPKKLPNTRIGWHRYFATKFNKNENPRTAQMSLWYLFLHLAFD